MHLVRPVPLHREAVVIDAGEVGQVGRGGRVHVGQGAQGGSGGFALVFPGESLQPELVAGVRIWREREIDTEHST